MGSGPKPFTIGGEEVSSDHRFNQNMATGDPRVNIGVQNQDPSSFLASIGQAPEQIARREAEQQAKQAQAAGNSPFDPMAELSRIFGISFNQQTGGDFFNPTFGGPAMGQGTTQATQDPWAQLQSILTRLFGDAAAGQLLAEAFSIFGNAGGQQQGGK